MNKRLLQQLSTGPYSDFIEKFRSSRYEFFGIVLHRTDCQDSRVGHRMLSSGHQGGVRFKLEQIVDAVTEAQAAAITMIHNHPHSNKHQASTDDIEVTKLVDKALSEHGAQVIDHVIFLSNGETFSFVENKIGRWGWDVLQFECDESD